MAFHCPLSLGFCFTEVLAKRWEEQGSPASALCRGSRSSSSFPSCTKRGPSWMEEGAYAQLCERHSRCDGRQCLCPAGRKEAEREG
ncbi:hypothetical protein AAES_82325 [Amazona aestiva]|uniref:Uncharacterized protein n=1 Tax=Amazona aestiva TaxID=12930 RepID=A0A0Q3PJY3_AMAAE|nr:hypothetical protein AAES_82325 [Amazona aestiva]